MTLPARWTVSLKRLLRMAKKEYVSPYEIALIYVGGTAGEVAVGAALHSDWHDFVSHEIVAVREIISHSAPSSGLSFFNRSLNAQRVLRNLFDGPKQIHDCSVLTTIGGLLEASRRKPVV